MGCNWGVLVNLDDGSFVVLGEVLARAGEGTIYAVVDRSEWVAKVFHAQGRGVGGKGEKLGAMIAHPPPGAVQSDGFAVLTWPVRLLVDAGGVVGYVMPRVDTSDAVEIHRLSNPVDRGNPLPSAPQWPRHASWLHLVNVAANLCLAVDVVHRVDAVIGDFQERNILVNDTTRVTLVDCDSMQVKGSDGRFFLCGVGRPEFTAPELAGVDLGVTPRGRASDLFALAVHIHLLLMAGNHPFLRGQWAGGGDQPDALSLARSGQWAGGPGSMLLSHPLAPSVGFLPPRVYGLFVRAFTDGARDPSLRPTAAEWRTALLAITMTTCAHGHQIPTTASACPWCAIDRERAVRKAISAQNASHSLPAAESSPVEAAALTANGNPSTRNRAIVIGGIAAAVIAVIVAIALNAEQGHRSASPNWTPAEPELTTTTTTTTSVMGVTDPSALAIRNASVGDCIQRIQGTPMSDGSLSVTVYAASCSSNSATDRVTRITDDTDDCVAGWVRTSAFSSPIVLCLAAL